MRIRSHFFARRNVLKLGAGNKRIHACLERLELGCQYQIFGVRIARCIEDLQRRTMFHYTPMMKHNDAMAHMTDQMHVVGDEYVRDMQALTEIEQEVDDLASHGHIEC